jgi:hypothetical protein
MPKDKFGCFRRTDLKIKDLAKLLKTNSLVKILIYIKLLYLRSKALHY